MTLYLSKLQLRAELDRCLQCKTHPCMNSCPVGCNPQEFIQHAKNDDWERAVHAIVKVNPLGQTCGLVCPDKFCMSACTRSHVDFPINIPRVQATILENYRKTKDETCHKPHREQRIAIVGAGPSGLAAADAFAKAGFRVELFESRDKIGGALNLIPKDRLPHEVIEKDWHFICDQSEIALHLNTNIDDIESLSKPFDAVIVATGAPHCTTLHIQGEEHTVSYMDYLSHPEHYQTREPVAIIGGGNVAVDCAHTALKHGASLVEMFIRRRISDMRISKREFLELIEAGIHLTGMTSPEKIDMDGDHVVLHVHRNLCVEGHWQPLEGTHMALPYFKYVIRAVGSRAGEKIDDLENVFYAGDCSTGGSTVVQAIASGKNVAESVIATLLQK